MLVFKGPYVVSCIELESVTDKVSTLIPVLALWFLEWIYILKKILGELDLIHSLMVLIKLI